MRSIRVLSLTQAVYKWLANSCHPRILHVFDHACNLINENKEILSIVPPDIGNGPFNAVIEQDLLFPETLHIKSQVSILEDKLIIGGLTFTTSGANCWLPQPDWKTLHGQRDKIARQVAQLPFPILQSPAQLTAALASALSNGDISTTKVISSRLAGLGPGLTPAGDDFIIGALYATWILHSCDDAEFLAKEAAVIAAPLSTSLSAAWLRAAGKGEAGIRWHELLGALTLSEPVPLQSAIKNIMAMGDTSGTESLAGFIGTFRSYMEIKE
jgi:hypothetical protein